MNYRHAFHAGNFADVLKHAVLVRILVHLRAKPAPFRVIDTHAGCGLYDLTSCEANRNPEWRDGVGRLLAAPRLPVLMPYLEAVAAFNKGGMLTAYPGSAALVRALMRGADRLIACELEPTAASALARNLRHDRRCKAIAIDGWRALNAYVPPKERRGLVLIDPPFEQGEDFLRIAKAIEGAHRKWPTGIYLAWYPLKDRRPADRLAQALNRATISKMLRVELELPMPNNSQRLRACGLILINPPWTIERELRLIMPHLIASLGPGGAYWVNWLSGEPRSADPVQK
jgi:23S rRNA (adenine2030-N6)-methyltransferase